MSDPFIRDLLWGLLGYQGDMSDPFIRDLLWGATRISG